MLVHSLVDKNMKRKLSHFLNIKFFLTTAIRNTILRIFYCFWKQIKCLQTNDNWRDSHAFLLHTKYILFNHLDII